MACFVITYNRAVITVIGVAAKVVFHRRSWGPDFFGNQVDDELIGVVSHAAITEEFEYTNLGHQLVASQLGVLDDQWCTLGTTPQAMVDSGRT